MKKVCHLTTAHPWNDVRIFGKECVSLSRAGYEVYLIAFEAKEGIEDGVHIVNAGIRPEGRLKRMYFGPKLIYKEALKIDADVYHFHDPELLGTGIKLQKKGKTVVYDTHEDVPRQILDKPYLNRIIAKLVSFLYERYERRAIKNISGIVCATPHIKSCFSNIHPLVDDINNFPLLSEVLNVENTGVPREDKVCYIGGLSEIRGILQLIESMSYCKEVQLELAGTFESALLKDKAEQLAGWSQVNELGYISRAQSLRVKAVSKAGLVTFLPAANHINAQPNKLFEYMSAGLPVICSNFSLWKDIVEKNNCGLCVDPLNPKAIGEAIQHIITHKNEAEEMGRNGRKAVLEKYNWDIEEQKLLKFYIELFKVKNNQKNS